MDTLFTFGAVALTKESLVQDLSMVLLVAGIVAALFHVISWPKVIGYICAGALISLGPVKRIMISDGDSVNVLANLGLIFLMFNLGLELNFNKLKSEGRTVFPAAFFDLCLMLLVGYGVGHYVLKWDFLPSIFLGAVICDSSTTLLAKSLAEMKCEKERFASIIFGITISEDVLTIGVMAILTGLALTGQFQARELAFQLGYLGLFLAGVVGFGLLLLPRCLNSILSRMKDEETLLIIVMGICFGIALVAEKMQFSLALGAFLVGAVASQSKVRSRIESISFGLRAVFSAVFFVAIGMMVDLPSMWANKWLILLITAVVLVFKTLNNLIVAFVTGQSFRDSFQIGVGLAQLGDFAYMVAMMGVTLLHGESPYPEMYQVAVGVSIITTLLNPFLLKGSGKVADKFLSILPKGVRRWMEHYSVWLERTSANMQTGEGYRQFVRMSFCYGVNLALMGVVFMVAAWFMEQEEWWVDLPDYVVDRAPLCLWCVCCFLCIPLFFNGFILSRRLGVLLAQSFLPAGLNVRGQWLELVRRLVRGVVAIVGIAHVIGVFCVLSALVCFQLEVMGGVVVVIVIIGFFRYKHIRKFFSELQGVVAGAWGKPSEEAAAADAPAASSESSVVVPSGAGVIGMSLKALQLRNHTGATVTRIVRKCGETLQTPGANDCLYEGDEVWYLCQAGREEAVRGYLVGRRVAVHDDSLASLLDLHVEMVALGGGSKVCGQTLAEARLRNVAGVTVVKITRAGGEVLGTPGASDAFCPGDVVALLGTSEQIGVARAILETPAP